MIDQIWLVVNANLNLTIPDCLSKYSSKYSIRFHI